MRAMVLAAGLGTRLRPLTDERAKPAVPVANVPMVAYVLAQLADFGVRDVALNAFHLPESIERACKPLRSRFASLTVLREPSLRGTGGGVRAALALLDDGDDVLVMNGDILFAPDLGAAVATHRALGAIATMVVREDPDAVTLGAVELDAGGVVRRLLGKPDGGVEPLRTTMFTGVHVLSPRALRELPEEGCIVRKSYRQWIDRGDVVGAHVETAPFRDLGTLRQYLAANVELASRTKAGNVVAPRADVYGATLRSCVVGDGAVVDAGVTLERVVVWDGAHATRDARDAVITPRAVVPVSP